MEGLQLPRVTPGGPIPAPGQSEAALLRGLQGPEAGVRRTREGLVQTPLQAHSPRKAPPWLDGTGHVGQQQGLEGAPV